MPPTITTARPQRVLRALPTGLEGADKEGTAPWTPKLARTLLTAVFLA